CECFEKLSKATCCGRSILDLVHSHSRVHETTQGENLNRIKRNLRLPNRWVKYGAQSPCKETGVCRRKHLAPLPTGSAAPAPAAHRRKSDTHSFDTVQRAPTIRVHLVSTQPSAALHDPRPCIRV